MIKKYEATLRGPKMCPLCLSMVMNFSGPNDVSNSEKAGNKGQKGISPESNSAYMGKNNEIFENTENNEN